MSGASLSDSFLLSLAFTIIDFTLATLTVWGNALLLVTILLNPLRCLRTPTTYLIVNLAFSDLLMGFVIGYSSAVRGCFMYQDKTPPHWMHAVVNVGGGATLVSGIWTVIAMAGDRYMAVTEPLRYSERIAARRVLIFVVLTWAITLTVPASFYSLARQRWTVFLLIYSHTHFTVPVFVLLFAYVRIFRSLANRRREFARLATSVSAMTPRHTLERERKMAFTTLTILILFCASFLPLYVKIQLLNFCKCLGSVPFNKFDFITHTFLYFSSLMDPFIYAWRVPKFRRSLGMCIRLRKRNVVRPFSIIEN